MEEDRLEKFIRDHRDEWDDKKAPDEAWTNILNGLPSAPIPEKSIWKRATILLGFVVILLLTYLLVNQPSDSENTQQVPILEYAELPNFQETEEFYISAIFTSQQKVSEQHIDATLEEDLSLLDQKIQELRKEYVTVQGAYKENVLRAIILNHQMKLQILERVLQNIQENEIPTNEKIY